jgi:anti-sigma B factor antagonist
MRIEREDDHGVALLRVSSCASLEAVNASLLKTAALKALAEGYDVVVDLAAVEFMDSAGVGVLVGIFKTARARGRRAVFAAAGTGVRGVLAIIRLDEIFELSPDAETAMRNGRREEWTAG